MKFILFIFLFISFFITPKVFAAEDFAADYDLSYAISPSGQTTVTQQISLTNLLSNFYPQKYSLLIDSDKISQIIAYDDGGIIKPEVSQKEGKTEIALAFNTKIVGLGKSTKFTLRYNHANIATKNGSIWELYIPGVVNDPAIDTYNVTLSVPPSFGPVAYLSPQPASQNTWNKEQMIRGGIAAAYGANQNFIVNLSYELQTDSNKPVLQQIALPPDTAYQKVIIETLDPTPVQVEKDDDGNWLATYKVEPNKRVAIQATLRVATYLHPRSDFVQNTVNTAEYLAPLAYWEKDASIVQHAKNLTTVRSIYDFVVTTLSYNEEKINKDIKRLGAAESLKQPTQAVCMEFTDLFIAIARANGIAARRNVGYAYTDNAKLRPLSLLTDILHTWPEYYNPATNLWVPIDPTWADTTGGLDYFTKLDFNHIVFAIQGLSSERPYPAGFYHDPAIDKKDVNVAFAPSGTVSNTQQLIAVQVQFPKNTTAGFTTNGEVLLQNVSGQAQKNIAYAITSNVGDVSHQGTLAELLPFAQIAIPLRIKTPFSFTKTQGLIGVDVSSSMTNYSFSVIPPYLLLGAAALGLLALILVILRITIFTHG